MPSRANTFFAAVDPCGHIEEKAAAKGIGPAYSEGS